MAAMNGMALHVGCTLLGVSNQIDFASTKFSYWKGTDSGIFKDQIEDEERAVPDRRDERHRPVQSGMIISLGFN